MSLDKNMKLLDFLGKNKIYVAMTIFIVAINLLILADKVSADREAKAKQAAAQEAPAAEEQPKKAPGVFPSEEEIKAREERILRLAGENPKMYLFLGLFNMTIIYLIFSGIVLDLYFLVRILRKRGVPIKGLARPLPQWGIGDIVRVVLIFLTSGYAFVIFQAFVADRFPILYNDNFRMVFNTAMMNLVGISVIVYFVRRKHGQRVETIGLTAKSLWRNMFYAVMGYLALIPVLLVIMVATYYVSNFFKYQPPVQPIVQVFMEEKRTAILWMSAMFAAVFGPVAEEIFFRGFMYPAVRKGLGIFWGMMITSAVFAFLHAHIVGFMPIFALGLLLVYLYEKTGSLVPSMAVHIMHNVSMVMLVFAVRSIGV